jgi:type I restriction enzyme S subunit
MKNIKKAPYFFYLWRTFYENDIMFNYEGKTSGLKNFMTDTFLANVWYDVPDNLTNIFYEKIIAIFTQIDNNIAENLSLTKQRDELLPLLMNGQVNFDLLVWIVIFARK